MQILTLLIVLMILSFPANSAIRFVVPNFPPYTYQGVNEIQGLGIDVVKEVLDHAEIDYTINITSDYDRAIYDVIKGNADGFFIASQNSERNKIAVFSKAVLLNNWSWFTLADTDKHIKPTSDAFREQAKIGTVLNTNTHKWLVKENYLVSTAVLNIELLINLLNKKHIDAIFVAQSVFQQGVKRGNKPLTYYRSMNQKVKPMGIYLSKKYLTKHPKMLEKINQSIMHLHPEINK